MTHKSFTFLNKVVHDEEIMTINQKLLLCSAIGSEAIFSTTPCEIVNNELNSAKKFTVEVMSDFAKYNIEKSIKTTAGVDVSKGFMKQLEMNIKVFMESLLLLCKS